MGKKFNKLKDKAKQEVHKELTNKEKIAQFCSGKLSEESPCEEGSHQQEGWIIEAAGKQEYCCIQNSSLRGFLEN